MIDVIHLSKTYHDSQRGEIAAVDDISFGCSSGEIFGLLGPNGAGKTTTLRMIATLLSPTTGTARINGHDIRTQSQQVRASIGFLSSTTGLYPRLTPRETLVFFARLHGMAFRQAKTTTDNLIERFGITEYADVRCEKLSSGMKQKVSIARALVNDPPVLVFDEPTVGLDVIAAAQTLKFVEEYRQREKCILYSTHIMSEAEKLCDRIAIIHRGSLLAIGSLEGLRNQTGKRYLEDIFLSLVSTPLEDLTG
ncbi:ATP-binding cassette domain-containing protein [bacterium]|nr:ATP-binding cassette domain-containing protein [candidate division CSSED10-310 bacterium]